MMIPELTLGTAVAFMIVTLGVGILLHGVRYTILEDIFWGSLLLLIAWAITVHGGTL